MGMNSFLFFFFFFFFLTFTETNAELITSLPGQPANTSFKQYSGYIVTDTHHGRALFYYFVEADVDDPLSRPLTLWFNGGPGCSSLGFGAFLEHGPYQPNNDGTLSQNKYSWNLESNMLYVESPIGVGFSYSNTSSNYHNWNDTRTAADNLIFLLNWLEEFPMYKGSELHLTGESYAGHYVPQLAALILQYNKKANTSPINLKAIAIGNPLLDLDISVKAGEYLWSHGAISDETLVLERTICDDSRLLKESYIHGKISEECDSVFNRVYDEVGFYTDINDLILPVCLSSVGAQAQQTFSKGLHQKIHEKIVRRIYGSDPCLGDRVFIYLNRPDVQKALHANTTHLPFPWGFCQGHQLHYQKDNLGIDIMPVLADLIAQGLPTLLFSGDQDAKIPLTQTRIIANLLAKDLKLAPLTNYGPWYDDHQVAGWAQSFGRLKTGRNETFLTYATVRGAAHEVPYTSPSQALELFRAFLRASPLPQSE